MGEQAHEPAKESSMHDVLEAAFDDQDTDAPPPVDDPPVEAPVIENLEAEPHNEELEPIADAPKDQAPVDFKAPQSWGVAEREAWANIPPEIKAQIDKREKEIGHSLTTTGEARRFQDEFNQAVQPFDGFIRAEGATPMQAVGNLLQTAATLQGGSQQQKATRIAELIKHYGIDIGTLDSLLAGEMPQNDPNGQLNQLLDQKMAPINQFMQQQQFSQQQQLNDQQATVQGELSSFEAQHEFVPDVRMDMADLMEMAGRRGETLTLNQAYERALTMRPDIQQVIEQRKAGAAAAENNRGVRQKQQASVSVPGGGAIQGGAAPPATMRDAILAAMGDS